MVALPATFLTHVKSNTLTRDQVAARLTEGRVANTARTCSSRCTGRSTARGRPSSPPAGSSTSTTCWSQPRTTLEHGYDAGYDLVLVDEFQDASAARARLVRALVDSPGRHLLAVGDDWQAITRFAGADLSLLTRFHDYFGPGPSLPLSTTFRCHRGVGESAAPFVTANPAQLAKTITAARGGPADLAAHEGVQLRVAAGTRGRAHLPVEFRTVHTAKDSRPTTWSWRPDVRDIGVPQPDHRVLARSSSRV